MSSGRGPASTPVRFGCGCLALIFVVVSAIVLLIVVVGTMQGNNVQTTPTPQDTSLVCMSQGGVIPGC
jgi:hypothetical protein